MNGTAADPRRTRAALLVASIALFTDAVLYGVAIPVLPQVAADAGASTAGVGVLFAVYAAGLIAATPIAGAWLDRRGARPPMLIGLFGLAAATVLFAFAREPALLITARALQGAAAGITWTASLALIAATHAPQARGKAMGVALSAFGMGTLLGPPLGGGLAGWLGTAAPFLLVAAVAVADGVARWQLIPHEDVPRVPRERAGALRGQPGVALAAWLTALGAAVIAFPEPILPLHLASDLQVSTAAIGAVFGAAALVAAVTPPLVGAVAAKVSPLVLVSTGTLVAAVGLAALELGDSVIAVGAALAGVALGATLVLTPTLALMADLAEARTPPSYGAVYAVYTLAYAGGLTVGPLIAGVAVQTGGFSRAVVGAAIAVCAASIALAVVAVRAADRSGVGTPRGESP